MRTLTLLNPPRRLRKMRRSARSQGFGFLANPRRAGSRSLRSFGLSRRLRRNPFSPMTIDTGGTILSNPKKSKSKKTMAKKGKKSGAKRRSKVSKGYTVKATSYRKKGKGKRKGARRRFVSLKTKFGSARIRRNPNILGGITGSLKSLISKDNLQLAGGVILSAVLNKQVMAMVGDKLPMASTPLVNTAYQAAIPAITSVMVRRFAPKVADGLVLGGLVIAVNGLLKQFAPQFAGFGAYVDGSAPFPTIPFPSGQELTPTTGSVDSATRMNASVGYSGIYDSPMPFESNAWAN